MRGATTDKPKTAADTSAAVIFIESRSGGVIESVPGAALTMRKAGAIDPRCPK